MIEVISHSESNRIGNKLIFLPRFKDLCLPAFIWRVFTRSERNYSARGSNPLIRYAILYAAKVAVRKAILLSNKAFDVSMKKIEIHRSASSNSFVVDLRRFSSAYECESITVSKDGDYIWVLVVIKTRKTQFSSFQLLDGHKYCY